MLRELKHSDGLTKTLLVHWETSSVTSPMATGCDITMQPPTRLTLRILYCKVAWRPDFCATGNFLSHWKKSPCFFLSGSRAEIGGSSEDEAREGGGGGGGAHCWRGSVGTPPPLSPPSMHTLTRRSAFPIFSSTAYHVIVETYAGEQADMCSGPGVHREAEGYTVRCR